MSKWSVFLGVFMLLTGGWVATTAVHPQSPKPKDAKVTFEALKKQLPDIVAAWCKSAFMEKPQIRIARRTSPEEAKITFQAITAVFGSSECYFTLYMRYYDGAWTVIRWEAGGDEIDQQKVRGYMLKLALAIDKATGE